MNDSKFGDTLNGKQNFNMFFTNSNRKSYIKL